MTLAGTAGTRSSDVKLAVTWHTFLVHGLRGQ